MTIEVTPLNQLCNIGCTYCYQQPLRDAGLPKAEYDLEKIKAAILAKNSPFTLFGGEPLLLPLPDLEELFALGHEKWKVNDIQTNASLITDAHISLFKKYGVRVCVSIDGPDELNDARRAGNLERTRETTARSISNFERLLSEGLSNSMIITLHRLNASQERLPRLLDWIRSLTALGLRYARLHPLEVDSKSAELLSLSEEDALSAMLAFRELSIETGLALSEWQDIVALLRGQDSNVTCIWNACDPWTTGAVQAIDGQGTLKNCGRTNKSGVDWVKAPVVGRQRQLVLYATPFEDGGCSGCRFFVACKGSCPGHAIDGDWRNRPRECGFWFRMFETVEKEMMRLGDLPVSKHPKLKEVELAMLREWEEGRQPSVRDGLRLLEDPGHKVQRGADGHGDGHGDAHGDHTDFGAFLSTVKGQEVR
jgi:radical SAM protein with 4Fe4S-binding SPASM domain